MNRYPFPAIVGQSEMTAALLLAAVNPRIGGVLIRGERGTAKSTAARALAALLPPLEAVEGCRCACDPAAPADWCDDCRTRAAAGETLRAARRPAPFVDLPVSATEDRVVGSLDLEMALAGGRRGFQPGLLAAANRGVLYVDEVNLLDDHLVDLLLDVAASGTNVVERDGITARHPSRFVLVGTMNPEEGDLRPQLLDRFGLCVDVVAVADPDARVQILERCLAFDRDPHAMRDAWAAEERRLADSVAHARATVDGVTHTAADLRAVATLAGGFALAGHRAELVILRAAAAAAALDGRTAITDGDILHVTPMALRHRLNPEAMTSSATTADAHDLRMRFDAARRTAAALGSEEKKTSAG